MALGNPIRSDDGVAICALQVLREDPRVPSRVILLDGGTKGLELVPYLTGATQLLVLDAVEDNLPAGTVSRLTGKQLQRLTGGGSVHELAIADILNALRLLDCQPRETVLLGVQPSTTELGTTLSREAEAAVPLLAEAAVQELRRWESLNPASEQAESVASVVSS